MRDTSEAFFFTLLCIIAPEKLRFFKLLLSVLILLERESNYLLSHYSIRVSRLQIYFLNYLKRRIAI